MKSKFVAVIIFIIFLFGIYQIPYAQSQRILLFEEGTSCNCGPCAQSNPIFDGWLANHTSNTQAIKYHPNFGADPMYLANPTQINERISYMGMYAWPTVDADGLIHDCCWPFTVPCFDGILATRMAVPTPIQVSVTDARIPGDSIHSTIVLNLASNLPAGNYKLRVMAVEGKVVYATPPGSNGETIFYQVFRWAYPNTTGIDAPTTAGTHTFHYTYKRLSNWVDTSIYTVAFVQNDVNKEVINSGRGYYIPTSVTGNNPSIPSKYALHQNYPNPFNPATKISYDIPVSGEVSLKIYDMLGKSVATLVNGFVPAGKYEYVFNASNLPTGIYMYELNTGNFSETKKMLLIK
ncbi:MAG: T9SS type A sorting domain-containing protein [Ignavibacteria bacterium]|nr:T9SS type A sorting domain-containing protein [Ignavibacteria bacterium]